MKQFNMFAEIYFFLPFAAIFAEQTCVMICKILDNGVIALLFIKLTEKRYEIFIS